MLSSLRDIQASLRDERNHDAYHQVVNLEIESRFAFQSSRWLGDVRPDLLSLEQREGLEKAKDIARRRREIERRIPKDMRFVKGWPTFVPSLSQCEVLAEVRTEIGALTGLPVHFVTAGAVRDRYQELLELNLAKKEKKERAAKG